MHFPPIDQQQASSSRFARGFALEGDARPGDVLALAGGALVRDVNENGRVDVRDARAARDGRVGDGQARAPVDELVGFEAGPVLRGGLVDVRG